MLKFYLYAKFTSDCTKFSQSERYNCILLKYRNIIVISECADAMLNCSQCSAYNLCTACDGDLVVNGTGDGCIGKMKYY